MLRGPARALQTRGWELCSRRGARSAAPAASGAPHPTVSLPHSSLLPLPPVALPAPRQPPGRPGRYWGQGWAALPDSWRGEEGRERKAAAVRTAHGRSGGALSPSLSHGLPSGCRALWSRPPPLPCWIVRPPEPGRSWKFSAAWRGGRHRLRRRGCLLPGVPSAGRSPGPPTPPPPSFPDPEREAPRCGCCEWGRRGGGGGVGGRGLQRSQGSAVPARPWAAPRSSPRSRGGSPTSARCCSPRRRTRASSASSARNAWWVPCRAEGRRRCPAPALPTPRAEGRGRVRTAEGCGRALLSSLPSPLRPCPVRASRPEVCPARPGPLPGRGAWRQGPAAARSVGDAMNGSETARPNPRSGLASPQGPRRGLRAAWAGVADAVRGWAPLAPRGSLLGGLGASRGPGCTCGTTKRRCGAVEGPCPLRACPALYLARTAGPCVKVLHLQLSAPKKKATQQFKEKNLLVNAFPSLSPSSVFLEYPLAF